jgi:hypothetical protein
MTKTKTQRDFLKETTVNWYHFPALLSLVGQPFKCLKCDDLLKTNDLAKLLSLQKAAAATHQNSDPILTL